MSFRKIDQFVGRHMSAGRWIVVYFAVAFGGGVFLAWRGWWLLLGIPMAIVGVFGIVGHMRRLR